MRGSLLVGHDGVELHGVGIDDCGVVLPDVGPQVVLPVGPNVAHGALEVLLLKVTHWCVRGGRKLM